MSAPPRVSPPSISSSGHIDGLGRRVIAFDREGGAMLEALHLRPELGAFEPVIRERIERLAAFEDERFARVRGVDRDPDTGDLVVVSEFVPGNRLSDLLDVAQEAAQDGVTPGVDVALGYLLEAMPAVAALHTATGTAHGAIAPGRTVLTPAGQVVFLDAAYGQVLERLRFARQRLWKEFGIAMPPSAGSPRFDVAADITQVALNGVMLVLGRPLRGHDYPDGLQQLMAEVVEVAQIRGSANFAAGIQRFLHKVLPLTARRAYENAQQAADAIRDIVSQEIGVAGCRRSLVEFVAQTAESLGAPAPAAASFTVAAPEPARETPSLDLDALMAEMLQEIDRADTSAARAAAKRQASEDEAAIDEEIRRATSAASQPEPSWRTPPVEEPVPPEPVPDRFETPEPAHAPVERFVAEPFEPEPAIAQAAAEPSWTEPLSSAPAASEPTAEEAEFEHRTVVPFPAPELPAPEAPAPEPSSAEPAPAEPAEPVPESPRRKRQRSARARKDKLRSIAAAVRSATLGQPKPAPAPLIPTDRAAAYEPDEHAPAARAPIGFAPPVAPPTPAPVPAPPVAPPSSTFAPAARAPAAPIPMPKFPSAGGSGVYASPSTTIWSAPPATPEPVPIKPVVEPPAAAVKPIQAAPAIALAPPALQQSTPIRLKSDGLGAPRKPARIEPRRPEPELYMPPAGIERTASDEPRPFPWKLALALLVIVAIGIVAGRAYLPSRSPEANDGAAAPMSPPAAAPQKPPSKATAGMGHLDIDTQPSGAKVLLDGQAAGETPLNLDVAPGRHVLTFINAAGSMRRNVRVEAGKTLNVDVPLFSGWIAIDAPIVLDVAESGKSIGSSEDGRLMLPPGRHELTLTNKELGYKTVQTVDIDSGDVKSLTVDARGSVNFNAVPWAEVWIDGKKAGDTPLANAQVPLGVRDVVFKHPELGERHTSVTVRGDTVAAVSMDLTRKQ